MIGEAIDRATDRIGERISSILRSYSLKIGLAFMALIFWLGVLACGCVAAFWALQPAYGPMQSIGIIAGGLAILGLLFGLAAAWTGRKITIADTIEPAEVVEEEAEEVVDTVGPYKFVAGALAAGALLGGSIGGRRSTGQQSAASGTSTILSMVPSILSIAAILNERANRQSSGHESSSHSTVDAGKPQAAV